MPERLPDTEISSVWNLSDINVCKHNKYINRDLQISCRKAIAMLFFTIFAVQIHKRFKTYRSWSFKGGNQSYCLFQRQSWHVSHFFL